MARRWADDHQHNKKNSAHPLSVYSFGNGPILVKEIKAEAPTPGPPLSYGNKTKLSACYSNSILKKNTEAKQIHSQPPALPARTQRRHISGDQDAMDCERDNR